MDVVICSIQDSEAARLGIPAIHALERMEAEKRVWVSRAEYRLPEGYAVKREKGRLCIYNKGGHRCPLIDSVYSGGQEGRPVLVDGDLPEKRRLIYLPKVSDLTFGMLKGET